MTLDTGNPENHLYLGEDVGSRAGCGGQLREFCSVELKMVGGGDFFSTDKKNWGKEQEVEWIRIHRELATEPVIKKVATARELFFP